MNQYFRKYQRVLITLLLICFSLTVKSHIVFDNINLEKALEKARIEKKLVFIDTYASWCAPCKIMDKVFEEKQVGAYFNKNFINIKVDMEGPLGPQMLQEYGVVWLPTLLILDQTGAVMNKIDKLLSGSELIAAVSETMSGVATPVQTQFNNNPFSSVGHNTDTRDYDPQSKAEVIYVYDQRVSSGRPHIMYHEAYLHLQLMDGKHHKVVKKYLSTQQDWSTEKNINFIFDFLQDANSKLFDYFITQRPRFESVIGKEKVAHSLSYLINQRIEQGYPRATLSEIIRLYSFQFENNVEERAYKVYLDKLTSDRRDLEYINTAIEYLNKINPHDDKVAYNLVDLRLNRSEYKNSLNEDLELMLHAVSLRNNNPDYYYALAKIYYHLSERTLAEQSISKSITLASSEYENIEILIALEKKILAL